MKVTLPPLTGPVASVWPLLFQLAEDRPHGWIVAGSQMVILHAAAYEVARPLATEDADVIVDVRELPTTDVADWLARQGFELGPMSPDGVGHRFRCGGIAIDLLAIDHVDQPILTTIPPARTIAVPGGRRAVGRVASVEVITAEGPSGAVPVPDWLGALLLKARAATIASADRPKHLQDFALLLGLPVDVEQWAGELAGQDRKHLRAAGALLDNDALSAVAGAINVRDVRAALARLTT